MKTATLNRGGASETTPNGIYAHIVGWGMAVPDHVMTNDDLAAIMETNDEWIQTRTGIRERRIATERDTTATLGFQAAQKALEVADILPAELDMVIVATSTPEYVFPSTASLIQDMLGATNAGAFDLSAACAGFVYATNMGAQAIRSGSIKRALIIGAETMSRVVDWQDRGTAILFGDGAGAIVLEAGETYGGVLSAVLRSDGSGCDLLGLPTVGSMDSHASNGHKYGKMHMNGGEVFKFATRVIAESVPQVVEMANLTMQDIALIVPHQANTRIINAAARALKVDESRFMNNIDRYGNTSAASIPIALCEAIQQGRVNEGDNIVFIGFGGGLSWAAMTVRWGIPHAVDRAQGMFIKRQRRQASYALARWRSRLLQWNRKFNDTVNRVRPKQGRMQRLRRKVDRYPLD